MKRCFQFRNLQLLLKVEQLFQVNSIQGLNNLKLFMSLMMEMIGVGILYLLSVSLIIQ
jgi:hypothetical protein